MRGPSEAIADILAGNGVIAAEDKPLYIYGLHQLGVTVLNIATATVLGVVMGMLWQSLLFLLVYIPLRCFAGGYHAKTELRCYVVSTLLIFIALYVIRAVPAHLFVLFPLFVFSSVVIFVLAPVGSANRPLDTTEYKFYRKRSRGVLAVHWGILLIAALLSALFSELEIVTVIVVVDALQATMLVFSIVNKQVERRELTL